MLLAGTIAKSRMAIILLDNLASILLLEHVRSVFSGSETFSWHWEHRFGAREQAKIQQDFSRQVTIASLHDEARPPWPAPSPLLDENDAAIFRIAHQYRNPIYHEDRHNPALLPVLGRLFQGAVCRAFALSYSGGGIGGPAIEERTAPLKRFGIDPMKSESFRGTFCYGDVASRLADPLTEGLVVNLVEARETLGDDVRRRSEAALGLIESLMRDGLSMDDVLGAVRWQEFWEAHKDDEKLVALRAAREKPISRAIEAGTDEERALGAEDHDAMAGAERDYGARMGVLARAFRPKVTLKPLHRAEHSARSLQSHTTMPSLLQHYRHLDIELGRVERCLDAVARTWDEVIQHEIDLRRGK